MLNSTILCLTLGLTFVSTAKFTGYCSTPEDNPGFCVPRNQCSNKFSSGICPGTEDGEEIVCCEEEINKYGLWQLNNSDTCGIFNEYKIGGGREVQIHSRPWMALLFYKSGGIEQPKCGGSLITDRFVLTAAHCIYIPSYNLTRVRLGEHHLNNDKYCNNYICEKKHEDFGIEKVIIHERYQNETYLNDIALIKLKQSVEFKAHILPICLPLNREQRESAKNRKYFLVAGWGYNRFQNMSQILLEALLNNRKREKCTFLQTNGILKIGLTQLCAGSKDMDSCDGDSGSPLYWADVYYDNQRMIQYGIVSYGSKKCNIGYPAVYTNVVSYIPWISRNIVESKTNSFT